MKEYFKTKDGKHVIYENGTLTVIVKEELQKQKTELEKRLADATEPTNEELLSWARQNYPTTDHSTERAELERINSILLLIK